MRNKLVVDIARYTASVDPLPLLEGGTQLVILKADTMFVSNGRTLVNAGMPIAAYHWIDPTRDAAKQVQETLSLIQSSGLPVLAVFPDFEQYWAKWDEWYKAIAGVISWSAVTRLGGQKLSDHARQVFEAFQASGMKTVGYTRASFVKEYAPQASQWIAKYPWWLAHYVSVGAQTLSWDEMKANVLPKVNFEPALPPSLTAAHVVGRQFTGDKLSLPGLYADVERTQFSAADLSLFDDQFLQSIGALPNPKPLPPAKYEAAVTASALNVRSGPGVNYPRLYTLKNGDKVEITDINKGWAKLRAYRDEWCSEEYLKMVFIGQGEEEHEEEQPIENPLNVNYPGVTYESFRRFNTNCHVLLIDPNGKRFHVTPFTKFRTVSQAAQELKAQIVVNGDGWGIDGRVPNSIAASDGKVYQPRQYTYRPWINISKDNKITFAWRKPQNLYNAVSGDRYLIQNGLYNQAITNISKAPRTAVGLLRDGRMILIVCDGRTAESPGLTFRDLATIMLEYGTLTAINLDGGGSTAMWITDRIVNVPIDGNVKGKERAVANHLCVFI